MVGTFLNLNFECAFKFRPQRTFNLILIPFHILNSQNALFQFTKMSKIFACHGDDVGSKE